MTLSVGSRFLHASSGFLGSLETPFRIMDQQPRWPTEQERAEQEKTHRQWLRNLADSDLLEVRNYLLRELQLCDEEQKRREAEKANDEVIKRQQSNEIMLPTVEA